VRERRMKGNGDERGASRERELAYLRERCRELESLLEEQRAQAGQWREIARVVEVLFEGYGGPVMALEGEGGRDIATVIRANREADRLLAGAGRKLEGTPLAALCAPRHRRKLRSSFRRALGGESVGLEADLKTAEGSEFTAEIHLTPYTIRGTRRVLCMGRDVTHRKRVEEALRESEERYRMLVENISDVIFSIDKLGFFTYISPVIERVSGYRPEEVVGRNLSFFMDPEDLRDLVSRLTFDENGWHPPIEFRVRDRDGGYRFVRSSGRLIRRSDGGEEVTGSMTDLTDRRLAEEALRESEERYRAVFEASGTAMCIVGEDGRISRSNQEFQRLTGFKTARCKKGVKLEMMIHPDDRGDFRRAFDGLEGKEGPAHFLCRLRARGNQEVPLIRANMARMPGTGSTIVSMLDITREKAYERTLEENARRLRDFLSVASHELRHPLAILKGYAQVLEEMGEEMPPERRRAALRAMQLNLERLGLLGEELLDVSLIEEERFTARRRLLDTDRLVKEVLEEMGGRGWKQEIRTDLDQGLRRMKADREKLKRLLVILLENACKYSPEDSVVELEMQRMGGEALIGVLDRGPGVPPGEEELIFHRFYQAEEAAHHSKPGIGLGLYIARQIVEAHGGRIWYESRRGGGSIFRVALPQE